jgi:hypothetical protein
MRVRISYSSELEDVPKEFMRLLEEAIDKTNQVLSIMHLVKTGVIPTEMAAENLEKTRVGLAQIDYKLSDIGMILSGYYEAIEQLKNPPQPEEKPEGEEDVTRER